MSDSFSPKYDRARHLVPRVIRGHLFLLDAQGRGLGFIREDELDENGELITTRQRPIPSPDASSRE